MELISFLYAPLAGILGGLIAPYLLEKFRSKLVIRQEQIKNQLKKSEFFFEKQFQAAQAFNFFTYRSLPNKQHYLEEIEDSMGRLAGNLSDYGESIKEFLELNDVLFTENTTILIKAILTVVGEYEDAKSKAIEESTNTAWYERDEPEYGERFYNAVLLAHQAIRNEVRAQIK